MNYILLITGIIILVGSICDLAYTTFSSNGAGFIANFITKGLWHIALWFSKNDGSKKFLEFVGILTIVLVIVSWFLLIWLGSALIFNADPLSVVDTNDFAPASTIEKFYYTGYTLTTLGNGDFKAASSGWKIFTVILSFSGFMLITTAVSYMLPVLSADVQKKIISKKIFILGRNPQEILLNHWENGNFNRLENYFQDLTDLIITHSQQLLAYPILYSFHNTQIEKSSSVSIAVLDEALTILLLHVPKECRPSNQAIAPLRKAIATFLYILDNNFIEDADTNASIPHTDLLQRASIPVNNDSSHIESQYQKLSKRRYLIGVMLKNEGWKFSDIDRIKSDPEQEL